MAVEAEEIVKKIRDEAKVRLIRKPADFVSQQIDEQTETRSDEVIADMFNTNRQIPLGCIIPPFQALISILLFTIYITAS